MKVKNMRISEGICYFTVISENEYCELVDIDYKTNASGQGLFLDDDSNKQVTGTCQFSLFTKDEKKHKNYYWIHKFFDCE